MYILHAWPNLPHAGKNTHKLSPKVARNTSLRHLQCQKCKIVYYVTSRHTCFSSQHGRHRFRAVRGWIYREFRWFRRAAVHVTSHSGSLEMIRPHQAAMEVMTAQLRVKMAMVMEEAELATQTGVSVNSVEWCQVKWSHSAAVNLVNWTRNLPIEVNKVD